ncbi:MAG: pyridine nucleotide-disulfide oxidoreductase [Simkaniaceae bacterium]|nr:pyridine nucleotide-disulfide oxidoreductase [Simkaniaceae bacterium]
MKSSKWTVVGAGPAGIAAVGKLLDLGIEGKEIAWIDPKFGVGDFGAKWHSAPSYTKVSSFLRFLYSCPSFNYSECDEDFAIHEFDQESTCQLGYVTPPLAWVCKQLKGRVSPIQDKLLMLDMVEGKWKLQCRNSSFTTDNVILAMGAEPKAPDVQEVESIPLELALDSERLAQYINSDDVVGVYGSSHSAMIALRNLLELPVKAILNFYRSPIRYAIDLEGYALFEGSGLKGEIAHWARENIDGKWPERLRRIYAPDEAAKEFEKRCTKMIYAIGFERRPLPVYRGFGPIPYHERSGIIAPGLFGLGSAFPEARADSAGHVEKSVGIWKFMDFLNRMLPVWLAYPI